jgi:hypothetical protein
VGTARQRPDDRAERLVLALAGRRFCSAWFGNMGMMKVFLPRLRV